MLKEDKELTYIEKQVILYFKLHFKINDLMEDLKIFVGREYALYIEQVENYSIYHFVVKLYFKLVKLNIIELTYEEFVMGLFGYEKSIDYLGMIKKLRSLIQNAKTNGIVGEPDFTLFPKKEEISISSNYDKYIENCVRSYTVPMNFDSWLELQEN